MLNTSQLLTSLKMDLGIYGLRLPFEDADKAIMEVITLKTLKTFSTYQPFYIDKTLDLAKDLEAVKEEYTESVYIIPDDFFGDRTILTIKGVYPRNKLLGNGFLAPIFDGTIDTYNTLAMTQANANLASVAAPPITFKFIHPNKMAIYNLATSYGYLDVTFGIEHAENLSTIPQTAWETFYELALLDTKRFLYNILKHYNELQTAYGNILLKIDDWANAESDRRDFVEKLKDIYHLDGEQLFII